MLVKHFIKHIASMNMEHQPQLLLASMMSSGPGPVPLFQRIPDNNNNEKSYRMLTMAAVVARVRS